MPLPKQQFYTSEDYWSLPEGTRAELIDGQFYNMSPPSWPHQKLVFQIAHCLQNYISANKGSCQICIAPFAVNLDANDKNWVEPDLSVVCDPSKLTDRGCSGAPDFIVEVVSPSSRKMDYAYKVSLYMDAGVREYWVVDPFRKCTTVYLYDQNPDGFPPIVFPFDTSIRVGIYSDLSINISELL